MRYKNWKIYFTMVSDDPAGFIAGPLPYHWAQVVNIKRDPFETSIGQQYKTLLGLGGALAAPSTAYIYDWNMLPIGQALWLKELETYQEFPPMQDPASYNLTQVMNELKKPMSNPGPVTGDRRVLMTKRAARKGPPASPQQIDIASTIRRRIMRTNPKPNNKKPKMKLNLSYNGLSLLMATAALFSAVAAGPGGRTRNRISCSSWAMISAWMQPSFYHQGLMVGETPNIDRIANEGAKFMDYYAEQSCTAGRNAFFTGMHRCAPA